MRSRLPATRLGLTHRAVIHSSDHKRIKFFITVNFYPDGREGEIFVTCDASGCTFDGFSDSWSTGISMLLQHGEPTESIIRKFAYSEFEPKGMSEHREIKYAKSIVDYVMRWITTEDFAHKKQAIMEKMA